MDYKSIEQLVERYWQGQTSPDDEARLRRFFSEEEVPPHLMRYKAWFTYQQFQRQTLDEKFDVRLLTLIRETPAAAKRVTMRSLLFPLLKATAILAVMIFIGNIVGRTTPSNDTREMAAAADTIGNQPSAPSVAISGETMGLTRDQQIQDSIKQVEKNKLQINEKK
ncbi:MAG: hypothetical protein LBL78_05745 [Prevotellaceae bacterium]|jgi:hypothetical protein|nr:hypothetical protein [Prevotellaceae bacterium]